MTPNQKNILQTVLKFYGVSKTELMSSGRTSKISKARHVIYLMLKEAGYSYPQIGALMNRDHTTVLHGAKLVLKKIGKEENLGDEILALRDMIAGDEPVIARDAWHNRYYKPKEPDPFDFRGMDICERDILLDVTKPNEA